MKKTTTITLILSVLVFGALIPIYTIYGMTNNQISGCGDTISYPQESFVLDELYITDHVWSSDGNKIAYVKCTEGQHWNCELWIGYKSMYGPEILYKEQIYKGLEYNGLEDWKDDWILFRARWEQGTPSVDNGTDDLWKIRDNGNDLTQITFTNTNGIRTTWSNPAYTNRGTAAWGRFIPGTNLVYFSAHNGNGWYKSYVCNDDGTDNWYPISHSQMAFEMAMSPTGTKLLYGDATYWNDPTKLWVSNVEGTVRVRIKNFSKKTSVIVLADGNTIVWNDNNNIYAMNMDGSNQRMVLDDAWINKKANYNPADGEKLIISSNRLGANTHLFEMKIDGTGITPLTDGPYNDGSVEYSPNGRYICYRRLPEDYNPGSYSEPHPYELVIKGDKLPCDTF